jgi:hypothetical protein
MDKQISEAHKKIEEIERGLERTPSPTPSDTKEANKFDNKTREEENKIGPSSSPRIIW